MLDSVLENNMIFDTHCHLNHDDLYNDRKEIIDNAKKAGVSKFLVVGYDKETSIRAVEIANEFDCCYAAIGFHPTEIFDITDEDYDDVMKLVDNPKVVAIGEIGLDYHWIKDPIQRELQKEYFIKQIEFANEHHLPICIHNRDSNEDCFNILKENRPLYGAIMHCYSGSVEMMQELIKFDGLYISLGGPVTFTNAKTPKAVAEEVPLDRLLIETDSPYLTPHPHRGEKNEPKHICLVSEEIARLKNMSRKHLEDVIYKNSLRIFGIKDEN